MNAKFGTRDPTGGRAGAPHRAQPASTVGVQTGQDPSGPGCRIWYRPI